MQLLEARTKHVKHLVLPTKTLSMKLKSAQTNLIFLLLVILLVQNTYYDIYFMRNYP